MSSADAKFICEVGGSAVIFPLFGDAEQEWGQWIRIVLYLVGLFWCFMGVAIISNVFMAAIEKVTSKKVRIFNKASARFRTYEVWNDTVANLTLMALGSSAPEILLNVNDIFAREFFSAELGPSTIVGSAAFNLLMIIGICIHTIPDGEVRRIKDVDVYHCTAVFSVFAYVWLIVILVVISPNVVEIWEGVLTFLFFPILVILAYVIDKGWLGGKEVSENSRSGLRVHADMTPDEWAEAEAKIRADHGADMPVEWVARIMQATSTSGNQRAKYRVNATRALVGGKRVRTKRVSAAFGAVRASVWQKKKPWKVVPVAVEQKSAATFVCEFQCEAYAVLENAGSVEVCVSRIGDISLPGRVWLETKDGKAKAKKDYKPFSDWVKFEALQEKASLNIEVFDDAAYEDDEEFFVHMSNPQVLDDHGEHMPEQTAELGAKPMTTITIIDDDDPGHIGFSGIKPDGTHVIYSRPHEFEAQINVVRRAGCCGELTCSYIVEGISAIAGRDFEAQEGTLTWADQQLDNSIKVIIKPVGRYEISEKFRIILSDATGGSKFDPDQDGGPERCVVTVSIEADAEAKDRVDKVRNLLLHKFEKSKVGSSNWAQQFREALYVNGGDEGEEDLASPTLVDYIAHGISLPWKILFALVPPTDYCGGWLCFFCALIMIGLVTLVIGDIASLLGCVMCVPDEITAITLVALGTSLPDTFASKTAALNDPYADAAVGNVTGSNSVNVFLGLGLPWMIAAVYWTSAAPNAKWKQMYASEKSFDLGWLGPEGDRKQGFVVKAGSLSFSVAVFAGCALFTVLLLHLRRVFLGGELGGDTRMKQISLVIMVGLWFVYLSLSIWKSLSEQGDASCAY